MKNKIIFFCLILVLSCNKTKTADFLSINDYPVKVGDQWAYQVIDYDHNQTDTAVIKVTAKTVFNNDSTVYNTQTLMQGMTIDSGIIAISSTSFKYVPTNAANSLFEQIELTFPINGQSVWIGASARDTLRVTASNQTMAITGKNYSNVFEIIRVVINPLLFNGTDTIFICPKIGIIELGVHLNPTPHKTLRLISYQLD